MTITNQDRCTAPHADENDPDTKLGYVIIHTEDHKRHGYISCDYVEESEAESFYNEVVSRLKFPEELLCRKALLKHDNVMGRYYTER